MDDAPSNRTDSVHSEARLRRHIVSRWFEYEGELRAAFLRVLLVTAFYAVQLIHFVGFSDRSEAEQKFQRFATVLVVGWLFLSLGVLVCIARRWLPYGLKYATSTLDVALLIIAAAQGNGPSSPLVVAIGLVVVMSGLRGNVRLVWYTTIIAVIGYWILVGMHDPTWFDANHETPVVRQFVVALTLAATGLVTGQMLRIMYQLNSEHGEPTQAVERV